MRSLLDVNLLLALFDSGHALHGRAHQWWTSDDNRPWATCPLTQNGFLRVISAHAYPNRIGLADARALLGAQVDRSTHAFWPDNLSILDGATFDHRQLLKGRQITDVYLLGLAKKNGGQLVTLDRGIRHTSVLGANAHNLVVL